MEDQLAEIEEFKELLENAKSTRSQLQGERKAILKNLEEEFSITDMREAKKTLKNLCDKSASIKEQIDIAIKKLRKYSIFQ